MRILVAYASKHGSTEEIAEFIGKTISDSGLDVDVCSISAVTNLTDYDGVIIGSAVYAEQWRPEVAQFMRLRVDVLAEKPVWLFSSGPTGHGKATDLLGGFLFPNNLEPYRQKIAPQDTVIFHGNLDLTKLTLAELMIVNGYGGPLGDYRHWETIRQWADNIVTTLARIQANPTASV
ncbi:MAG: flavodoxin domain-containing protein [Anaerolineae bacterium]|nr:flavodoxin domain-containing protein [Anaerolineae bacterium]MDQ7037127.1 flavodoxin domain-containing protein [Anaerolineae bacterium]